MARPKKPDFSNHAARIKETCSKHRYDPFEKAIMKANEVIQVPADFIPKIPKRMYETWDLIPNEDGSARMELRAEKQIDTAVKLMPYCYPQLKSSESREQVDYQISWVVKQYTVNAVTLPAAGKSLDKPVIELKEPEE